MSKLEITIDKADELINALARLAMALENKSRTPEPLADESAEVTEEEASMITFEQPEELKPLTKVEKAVTLVQIRAVLTAKSQAGKKAAFGELFKKYDADKLSAVDPSRYADFLKDVEAL